MKPRYQMPNLHRANPVPVEPEPPAALFDAIVEVETVPAPVGVARPRLRRKLFRSGQAALALLAILGLGVGAAWAATGTNPIAKLFTKEFSVGESDYAIDKFSILEPMTEAELKAMPERVAMMAGMMKSMHITTERLERKLAKRTGRKAAGGTVSDAPPTGDPGTITAIGHGTTTQGNEVTMMVLDGQICYQLRSGSGGCDSLEGIEGRGSFGASPEPANLDLARVSGIVTDEVRTMEVEGRREPPTTVTDNVFEFRRLKPKNIALIGRNDQGDEILRLGVPLKVYAQMDD